MKTIIFTALAAIFTIGATVAVSHYMAESAKVLALPNGA